MALTDRQVRTGQTENPGSGANTAIQGPKPDIEAGRRARPRPTATTGRRAAKPSSTGRAGKPGYSVADFDANIAMTEGAGEA